MERKIGEVFEYNGEWYQCVIGCHCSDCAFNNDNCEERERITLKEKLTKEEITGLCASELRNDKTPVIFKKLEKVGEPFSNEHFGLVQKYELKRYGYSTKDKRVCFVDGYDVFIKIKQNKEDMEEKKSMTTKFREYLSKVSEEQLEKDLELIKKFNESGVSVDEFIKSQETTQMKPFDLEAAKQGHPVCCRNSRKARIICFDANVEKGRPIVALLYDGKDKEFVRHYTEEGKDYESCSFNDLMMCYEPEEVKFKPFDLEEAKEGKSVCTRDGRKARIICFDAKGKQPIIALFEREEADEEIIQTYNVDGSYYGFGKEDHRDLMMLPEKKSGWVNIVKEVLSDDRIVLAHIFDSYEDAFRSGKVNERYIAIVKIEWTE